MSIRYFSMFSGIGGFERAIQQVIPNAKCVGYSEIDKPAIKTYEEHFNHDNYGDATTINAGTLPDFELGVMGFPCQPFSIGGKRAGFDDIRGTLFFDIARILEAKQPQNFILENVKGILSHDGGRTFRTIITTLNDLGYMGEWQILNSKNHGVPHNRERIYIVGHLAGRSGPKVFPFTGSSSLKLEEITQGVAQSARIYRPTLSRTLKALGGGQGAKTGLYVDETAPIGSPVVRRLTPVECERLQGFPDNWTIGSDTQRTQQCGNAVTVNVVRDVVTRLYEVEAA